MEEIELFEVKVFIRERLRVADVMNISELRNAHGLTQRYCADMCHVSTRTWQKYEREGAPIWLRELFALKLMVTGNWLTN